MENQNKYGIVELIFGLLFYMFIDGISLLLDFTGVGLIIAPIIQSFGTFSMNLWAWAKGDKNSLKLGRQIVKYMANFLPLLPTLTIVFLIETFLHNHPKIGKVAGEKFSKKLPSTA